jgi:hypothetical protein
MMHTFYTITPAAMQLLKGCSYPTARKELARIREALQLREREPLQLRQLAAFWDCSTKELAEALYYIPKKQAA